MNLRSFRALLTHFTNDFRSVALRFSIDSLKIDRFLACRVGRAVGEANQVVDGHTLHGFRARQTARGLVDDLVRHGSAKSRSHQSS